MDSRPVIWDAANRRHVERDHPERNITWVEVDEVLRNPARLEGTPQARGAVRYVPVIGQTASGRWLYVVYVDDAAGRYPVHARRAGSKMRRRFR
jgi:hypothetical protein